MTGDIDPHDQAWCRRHALMYRLQLSTLYHRRRERFFSMVDRLTKAVAVIGGSAAMVRLTGDCRDDLAMGAGAVVAITSLLGLVIGYADQARRHADMAGKFKAIEADYVKRGELGWTDLDALESELLEIERAEPPTLRTLVILVQNDLAIAQGEMEKVQPISLFRRSISQVW